MRVIAGIFALAALGVVSVSAWIFFSRLGKPLDAVKVEELVDFGTYFGGVAGPLLALLTVVGLALTMMMQNLQIEQVALAGIKDQHVRMLTENGHDLASMEAQHLEADVTLGDVLSGKAALSRGNQGEFRRVLPLYVEVLGFYVEGVALYRDNISRDFDCKVFERRALRLLNRVAPFGEGHLDQPGRMALGNIRALLNRR